MLGPARGKLSREMEGCVYVDLARTELLDHTEGATKGDFTC